jgi:drug/metabolite transporter (DMT)-like permease
MSTTDPSSRRKGEVAGFALSLAFAGTTALRDVYFGGLFQRLPPLLVALTAFGLCSLVFLPVALIRDRGGLAALVRRPGRLCWINATTAIAWLSFFFALGTIEPALVQILFYGVGPLSVRWVDRLVPGSTPTALNRTERRLHLGLLASLVVAGVVVVGGLSGLGPQPTVRAIVGIALAVGGGVSISISTLLCRVLNDDGVRPSTLLAMRFPGAIVLAGTLALLSPAPTLSGVTPSVFAGIALASVLLIVLPNYVNQIGVALASPVTVRAVLALGPVLVFLLQLVEGRLSSSGWTLAAALLYAVFAIAATLARRQAITGAATVTRKPASRPRGLEVRREPGSIA